MFKMFQYLRKDCTDFRCAGYSCTDTLYTDAIGERRTCQFVATNTELGCDYQHSVALSGIRTQTVQ